MRTKSDLKWQENYEQLKDCIVKHHHLPNKKKVENRGLLNWWKYNKKLVRLGKMDMDRVSLLEELNKMRDVVPVSLGLEDLS